MDPTNAIEDGNLAVPEQNDNTDQESSMDLMTSGSPKTICHLKKFENFFFCSNSKG
jgi:hypothetical protein